jgi:hypothetical protein
MRFNEVSRVQAGNFGRAQKPYESRVVVIGSRADLVELGGVQPVAERQRVCGLCGTGRAT